MGINNRRKRDAGAGCLRTLPRPLWAAVPAAGAQESRSSASPPAANGRDPTFAIGGPWPRIRSLQPSRLAQPGPPTAGAFGGGARPDRHPAPPCFGLQRPRFVANQLPRHLPPRQCNRAPFVPSRNVGLFGAFQRSCPYDGRRKVLSPLRAHPSPTSILRASIWLRAGARTSKDPSKTSGQATYRSTSRALGRERWSMARLNPGPP